MKPIHLAAGLALVAASSYAAAASPEARLGGPVALPGGTAKSGEAPAAAQALPAQPGAAVFRYGAALDALQPEGRAATRGATETRVYQRASPAVVLVVSEDGLGSGVLVEADGVIITNLHVVGDEDMVGVIFKPTTEGAAISKADLRPARVLRRDEVADLAMIKVDEVPADVKPLALGDSDRVQVGADVHAIGHPTGQTWTYTRGIVSQVRRSYAWTAEDGLAHEATVIQTQTPINPGNSGGPLLDDQAHVLGINSFISDGEGLNFAVSAEDVKSFLARPDDRKAERVERECRVTILSEKRQDDPPATVQALDGDCDGEMDALMTIPDDKDEPLTIFADENGDGEFDTLYFDDGQDGDFDEAMYDTDGDGKPDLIGYYRNGEREPYRWEKMEAEG